MSVLGKNVGGNVPFVEEKTKKNSIFIWQFHKNAYLCTANEKVVVGTTYDIVLWCNGSTTDSGPVCPGSNPGRTTFFGCLFLLTLFYGVMVAQQILVLFVQVRILVEQRKAS